MGNNFIEKYSLSIYSFLFSKIIFSYWTFYIGPLTELHPVSNMELVVPIIYNIKYREQITFYFCLLYCLLNFIFQNMIYCFSQIALKWLKSCILFCLMQVLFWLQSNLCWMWTYLSPHCELLCSSWGYYIMGLPLAFHLPTCWRLVSSWPG